MDGAGFDDVGNAVGTLRLSCKPQNEADNEAATNQSGHDDPGLAETGQRGKDVLGLAAQPEPLYLTDGPAEGEDGVGCYDADDQRKQPYEGLSRSEKRADRRYRSVCQKTGNPGLQAIHDFPQPLSLDLYSPLLHENCSFSVNFTALCG